MVDHPRIFKILGIPGTSQPPSTNPRVLHPLSSAGRQTAVGEFPEPANFRYASGTLASRSRTITWNGKIYFLFLFFSNFFFNSLYAILVSRDLSNAWRALAQIFEGIPQPRTIHSLYTPSQPHSAGGFCIIIQLTQRYRWLERRTRDQHWPDAGQRRSRVWTSRWRFCEPFPRILPR